MLNEEPALSTRGSLRSRGAAAISSLALRQLSAVLPPEQAWGLWLSRHIVARIMDTFGPTLASSHVQQVDTRMSDGRRVIGEWVYGAGIHHHPAQTAIYFVAGGDCELEVWPDQLHVFQALPRLTPETQPTMRQLASFISQTLSGNDVDRVVG